MMVVCLDNIYERRRNEISKLRCRTIIIGYSWFCLSLLLFFLYNENTNYGIWIKQYYHLNQPCNKLQNLCSLGAATTSTTIVSFFGFESFIITRINDLFIY